MQVLSQVNYLAMETVVNAIVAEILVVPVTNHIRYLLFCKRYVTDMRTKTRELDVLRVGVENRINLSTRSHIEIPPLARDWLDQVQAINAKVENFPRDVFSCFSLRTRYKLGRKAFKIIKEIESIKRQHFLITWTESMEASISKPLSDLHDFQSREQSFIEALKAIAPSHYSHMIALCGMGGVGKTTMIKKLKKVVRDKKMFDFMVEVIIGDWNDPLRIQDVVASYLGIELKEGNKLTRAEKLQRWFQANSDGGKTKFLVILEDVWQPIDLEDIGLSHFPTQGVDFKILLTSRDIGVCKVMGVEDNSVIIVDVLTETEGQSLFRQFIKDSNSEMDPAFHEIADNIVRRCQGLPIAIKTLALSLKGKSKPMWEHALDRLENLNLQDIVDETFKLSYNSLEDKESESIFLLCGLFPPDFDIPTEELLRYGWGLKLFIRVSTIREARYRLNVCIKRLMDKHLLIKNEDDECVKMHDLVHAFVLGMFSEVEHASIVNYGRMRWYPQNYTSNSSYKSVSLTCKGMSEFPRDLKFPNISILKLMHADKSLKFPPHFYESMEKIQVISYYGMKHPLLPSSPQCSTNLRVLHLNQCSLMFDCSYIGNLFNLEVLSFANSSIELLPSTIGNLKKLRILDLRGCGGLRIDNGVLENLVKLEELYATVSRQYGKAISFTVENCNEMEKISSKLSVLEFEFFENNAQPKNASFENLEGFKISVGRSLEGDYLSRSANSLKNTLKLITSKGELFASRMHELFSKTEVLCLSVEDINDLEDVEVKSSPSTFPRSSSFKNVRVLVVSRCSELKCLFTLGVANALLNLEDLQVFDCSLIEELIYTEGSGQDRIGLPMLKSLSLCNLPNLLGLCRNINIIQLPQLVELELEHIPNITSIYPNSTFGIPCFFKNEMVIPKLERLKIYSMENLKEIWPWEFRTSEEIMLREISVSNCDNLVHMFPYNPMTLLRHLQELKVRNCDSIEVLFNIDLDCAGAIGEDDNSSSLRSITVRNLGKLREVWRIKDADNSRPLVRGFQAVESISIGGCERFRNIFTPATSNFDLGALTSMSIKDCSRNNESVDCSREEKLTLSEEERSLVFDRICDVLLPSYLVKNFHELRKLELRRYEGVEVVFEIDSPTSKKLVTTHHNQKEPILPNLHELYLYYMDNMSHVWKCNDMNQFDIFPSQQSESPFHNLTTICVYHCNHIKYLFSPQMAKLLSNLKKVEIDDCNGIEEVISNRDNEDEKMTTFTSIKRNATLFPYLNSLTLGFLPNLKCIGGGLPAAAAATTSTYLRDIYELQAGGDWSLFQYSGQINILCCDALSSVIPCYAAGQMQKLQVLRVVSCNGMKEVFETQGINNNNGCDEGYGGIPRLNNVIWLPSLKILEIEGCPLLVHIFTFLAYESLTQLQELRIKNCEGMKVILNKEDEYGEQQTTTKASSSNKVLVFPRLKSIKLVDLPNLEGFFLGMNEFRWPLLDDVTIKDCPKMRVFAAGGSTAPILKYIRTSLGTHHVQESGLNFTTSHHQTPLSSLASTSSGPATSEGVTWSFHNLVEMDVRSNRSIEKIIRFKEMLQLQKLEKIHVSYCHGAEEVFEALEGTISTTFDVSQTTIVQLPMLREVELKYLDGLRYIWKSNQWTTFEFPNLTRVHIYDCKRLEHVFTSSMVGSLLQLQEIHISQCKLMKEVIVKDENVVQAEEEDEKSDGKTNEIVVLPCLKSLTLDSLLCLEGFCLEKEDYSLPLLDVLRIKECPSIVTFTKGNSATPQLNEIETSFRSFYVAETDINSFIKIKQEEFRRHSPMWM
ncbi:hypothetical protein Lser_V15G04905 [Lactuca serriola]